ncbi:MAG: hypothetical protein HZC38_14105 [Chloroflexi bacterium]|nr:hypothetical protein [Chloroflexota bacterium]MBI5347731.1 hypothetical protein [Chloroflexota bacterium]MBI5714534.1 hypothetical protein [Chloroflexota bacterium]
MTDPTEEEFTDDEEILDEDEEATASEGSSNRTFIFVAIGLGALFLCGVVAVVGYLLVFAPTQSTARQTQVAAIAATNAQVAIDAQNTANPPTATSVPTETPTLPPLLPLVATNTPVLAATELPTLAAATITPGPSPTPSRTPTRIGGATLATGAALTPGIGGGGVDTRTPTRIVSLSTATPTGTRPTSTPGTPGTGTSASGIGGGAVDLTQTRTPTPTGLPETGFAEDVGIPTMIIAAILLIGIVIVARQLRTRTS